MFCIISVLFYYSKRFLKMEKINGGKREGAGRKFIDKSAQERRNISITPELFLIANEIGNGNASSGIRLALKMYNEFLESEAIKIKDESKALYEKQHKEGQFLVDEPFSVQQAYRYLVDRDMDNE